MTSGEYRGRHFLCIASRRTVVAFELNRLRARHQKLKEFQCPDVVQSLQMMSDGRVCVGCASYFALYAITPSDNPVQGEFWRDLRLPILDGMKLNASSFAFNFSSASAS